MASNLATCTRLHAFHRVPNCRIGSRCDTVDLIVVRHRDTQSRSGSDGSLIRRRLAGMGATVSDMYRVRPIVNKIQTELWGQGPYPPRTILEVQRLNQDDIVEIEGTFWIGGARRASR